MNAGAATVLVVRPRAQAQAWVDELAALGVAARALPLIEILATPEPAHIAAALAQVAARAGADRPAADDAAMAAAAVTAPVLVFVSPNAALGFFRGAAGAAWPAGAWAAATGPGTVAALRACGVPEARIVAPPADAAQFDSEALWQVVSAWPWAGRPVWIVRGNGGRDWLGDRLRAAGAAVQVLQSYARAAPALSASEQALLARAVAEPARWVWLFSSSEAIGHLRTLAPLARWDDGRALASHPRIAESARALGFGAVDLVVPSPAAVAAAVARA